MLNFLRSSATRGARASVSGGGGLLGFTAIRVPYDCILYAQVRAARVADA